MQMRSQNYTCTLGFLAAPRGRCLLWPGVTNHLEGIKQLASRWGQRRRKPGDWWLWSIWEKKTRALDQPTVGKAQPLSPFWLAKRMSRGTAASMGCLGTGPPWCFLYAPRWVYRVIPWGVFWDGSSCGSVSAAVSISKIFGECFFANCHFLMGYSCWCLFFNYTEFDACYYNWHSALCFVWRTVCNQEEEERNWLYQLLSWSLAYTMCWLYKRTFFTLTARILHPLLRTVNHFKLYPEFIFPLHLVKKTWVL